MTSGSERKSGTGHGVEATRTVSEWRGQAVDSQTDDKRDCLRHLRHNRRVVDARARCTVHLLLTSFAASNSRTGICLM